MTRNRFFKGARLVLGAVAVAVAISTLGACGGAQRPPSEGQCLAWREWVAPQQQDDGTWRQGYCRDREGQTPGETPAE